MAATMSEHDNPAVFAPKALDDGESPEAFFAIGPVKLS
jgi:hypothetical protein